MVNGEWWMINVTPDFGLIPFGLATDYYFFKKNFAPILKKAKFASQLIGFVAEWLGRGLQNLLQRFESARNLQKPSYLEGFFMPITILQNILKIVQFYSWGFILKNSK